MRKALRVVGAWIVVAAANGQMLVASPPTPLDLLQEAARASFAGLRSAKAAGRFSYSERIPGERDWKVVSE